MSFLKSSLSILFCLIASVILFAIISVVSAAAEEGAMDIADVAQQRERNENELVTRARSKLGTVMTSNQLINYCLNPAKSIDRFNIEDHSRMKDNELGLFVIDKGGKQIGLMSGGDGTIIYSSARKGGKIVEEKVQEAKNEFPMGWRRIGPDGILKEKYQFKRELGELLKGAGAAKSNSHIKEHPLSSQGKPAPVLKDCPDCQKNNKKENGDL